MPATSPRLPLRDLLRERTREGALWRPLGGSALECFACGHRCVIKEGREGICKVRYNEGGRLRVPWGYAAALQCDPVEKKPFFHARPGALALSFGMLGCDYHCGYCQNWVTSQALRDPVAGGAPRDLDPAGLVALARELGAEVVTSTYNEPLITSEWAVDVFRAARAAGLVTSYVSNGNGTPEVLEYIRPWVDLYKVDLKGFDDKHYRQLGGVLKPVLDTILALHAMSIWLEVVTLVVPGHNDDEGELRELARFLASVSPDIPWHVTAFHPDYKMQDRGRTAPRSLVRAVELGREAGLRFVYAGNLPGRVGELEHTFCPACGKAVVERHGFRVLAYHLVDGACPGCGSAVPGRWERARASEVPRRDGRVLPL